MLKSDYLIIAFFSLVFITFFIFYQGSWYHIENLMAHKNSMSQIIEKGIDLNYLKNTIFLGEYFDNNPSRFRPISHVFELLDHLTNNFLISIFGINLLLNTPSNLIFLLGSSLLLIKIFSKNNSIYFYLIIFILISSTAYLSNIFFLLRPSKKLGILFSLLIIFILDNKDLKINTKIVLINISLFICLLCDEEYLFFFPVLSIIFIYKNLFQINKIQLKEYIYINIFLFLIYIYFVFFHNQNSYFNGVYYNSGLSKSLSIGINTDSFLLYLLFLLKNFFYLIFGFNHFSVGIIFFGILFYINKKLTNTYLFFKYEKLFFILSIYFMFLIFQTLLELIGGNIILRSIGYYYGSSKFIIFILIIYLYNEELNSLFNSKINYKFTKVIFSFFSLLIILLNLINFSYANKLNNYMHYKNIDVEIFNTQLTQLKKEPNKDYKWDNLYLKANHQETFSKLLEKLNIKYQYFIKLIKTYDNMMPKKNIIEYEVFLKKLIL